MFVLSRVVRTVEPFKPYWASNNAKDLLYSVCISPVLRIGGQVPTFDVF